MTYGQGCQLGRSRACLDLLGWPFHRALRTYRSTRWVAHSVAKTSSQTASYTRNSVLRHPGSASGGISSPCRDCGSIPSVFVREAPTCLGVRTPIFHERSPGGYVWPDTRPRTQRPSLPRPRSSSPIRPQTIFTEAAISELDVFLKKGKPYLKCLASGKDRPAKPEEIVRQLYIKKLIADYGYPADRIAGRRGGQSREDALVIGISSRALFDLEKEDRVFREEGLAAYRRYQRDHEADLLQPGTAFPLVRGLLALNQRYPEHLAIRIVVMSRNSADAGVRILKSAEIHGLDIRSGVFSRGESLSRFLGAFQTDLFLSKSHEDVQKAIDAGTAAPAKE